MARKVDPNLIGIVDGMMFTTVADNTPDTVGSPGWRSWVIDAERMSVNLGNIQFTIRRERVKRFCYFYAYKRIEGKLHKRYVGMETALTMQRLIEIGASFRRIIATCAGKEYLV